MDAVTALKIAFIAAMLMVAVCVIILEGMRYYRTLGDLDQAQWEAYYHERIWDPENHEHGE